MVIEIVGQLFAKEKLPAIFCFLCVLHSPGLLSIKATFAIMKNNSYLPNSAGTKIGLV